MKYNKNNILIVDFILLYLYYMLYYNNISMIYFKIIVKYNINNPKLFHNKSIYSEVHGVFVYCYNNLLNAEIRSGKEESVYMEFNTPVAAYRKRGWLNIAHWEVRQQIFLMRETAAAIECKQIVGSYVVKFDR